MKQKITVEVAYASESKQFLRSLTVEEGTLVIEAIESSGVCLEFPELDLEAAKIGIFSNPVSLHDTLKQFDRVEIYRPLLVDPMEARRRRANRKRTD